MSTVLPTPALSLVSDLSEIALTSGQRGGSSDLEIGYPGYRTTISLSSSYSERFMLICSTRRAVYQPHVRVPPHTAQVAKALSIALGKSFTLANLTASLSARAKLRPRLLVASGHLIPSPEILVSTDKDLLIPRVRAGLEASYLLPISPPSFSRVSLSLLDRLLPNAVDPMASRKGDLVLYSDDIFPTETRKLPSCPRSDFVNRMGNPTHILGTKLGMARFFINDAALPTQRNNAEGKLYSVLNTKQYTKNLNVLPSIMTTGGEAKLRRQLRFLLASFLETSFSSGQLGKQAIFSIVKISINNRPEWWGRRPSLLQWKGGNCRFTAAPLLTVKRLSLPRSGNRSQSMTEKIA
uniref:Uncharacterized protein n=1 Tax=Solanum lycopersicum TaxID=4081 RepID=K4CCK7_SOLLC